MARYELLPLRIDATESYNLLLHFLLMTVTTSSELGTIANLEQHNLLTLNHLNVCDSILLRALEEPLPSSTHLQMNYEGPSRLILQAPTGILEKDTDLYLKVRVLNPGEVKSVKLYWKAMGSADFKSTVFQSIDRNVFEIILEKSYIHNRDLEYYVEAILDNDEIIQYPTTAGTINQTVIIF